MSVIDRSVVEFEWKWNEMKWMHVTSACDAPLNAHQKNSLAAPFLSVVCENLWRARKLFATHVKSLPKRIAYIHKGTATYRNT